MHRSVILMLSKSSRSKMCTNTALTKTVLGWGKNDAATWILSLSIRWVKMWLLHNTVFSAPDCRNGGRAFDSHFLRRLTMKHFLPPFTLATQPLPLIQEGLLSVVTGEGMWTSYNEIPLLRPPKIKSFYLLKTLFAKFKLFFSSFSTPSVPLIRYHLWDCPKVVFKTTFGQSQRWS